MDLKDLENALDEIRPDDTDEDWGLRLAMTMLGNVSEGLMRIDTVESDMETAVKRTGHTEEDVTQAMDLAKQDMIGALFVAVAELAHENGVSINDAVEARLERMREAKKQRERVEAWEEAGIIDPNSGQVNTDLEGEDDWAFM